MAAEVSQRVNRRDASSVPGSFCPHVEMSFSNTLHPQTLLKKSNASKGQNSICSVLEML